ncbi:NADP-dependent malic enzyme [Thalassobacillus sp. C254]|uniref:NAD(P)-dependent malic enzyme n=1 Tax=Thalassobacillus sp. C254 TaxID=1225341 RepID=UPI0006D09097|nr:malic enzyme-like NAD(P)-binding protein [Thalassobacillus sp. C254]
MSNLRERALALHKEHRGKLHVNVKMPVNDGNDLSLVYSPGVAEPCKEIAEDPEKIYDYTSKSNLVGVVSNGSAVLGLGNIGAGASMPVMEGKAALFKEFAGLDAFPICLDESDPEKLIQTIKMLEPTFGGINLEDIAAPDCFLIEQRLKEEMNIPVFHDDQHGTAIVTAAGLINALRIVDKKVENIKVVINGAGSAGVAVTKLLRTIGINNIIICDSIGPIYKGRTERMTPVKEELAELTNSQGVQGSLEDATIGADVFIGVSVAGALTQEMVEVMSEDSIIFAMANPVPEIMPAEALAAGAKVIGTGRSDLPNQVNNVLAFPGIFRGALDCRASTINEEMKLAAVYGIADLIPEWELSPEYIIPQPFDKRVVPAVRGAVIEAAINSGAALLKKGNESVKTGI